MQQLKSFFVLVLFCFCHHWNLSQLCGHAASPFGGKVGQFVARAVVSFNGGAIFLVACRSDTLTIVVCARVESRLEKRFQ